MADRKGRARRKKREPRNQARKGKDGRRRVALIAGSGLLAVVAVAVGIVFALSSSGSSGQDGGSDVSARLSQTSVPQPSSGRVGIRVGDQIPDVGLRLVDGSAVNVASLVSARKPVFLFFFATW